MAARSTPEPTTHGECESTPPGGPEGPFARSACDALYRMTMHRAQRARQIWIQVVAAASVVWVLPFAALAEDRKSERDAGAPPGSERAEPVPTAGHALGPLPGRFSASLTFATEYVWRGVSQSSRKPAGQAEVDWRFANGLYVGTWISNVDFGDGPSFELDLFAGYVMERGDLELDFGFVYFMYPLLDIETFYPEFTINAVYDFGRVRTGGFFALTWNYGEAGDPAYYPAFDVAIDLVWTLSLETHVGYQFGNGSGKGADEFDWSVGLAASHWGFDARLAYVDTNRSEADCGRTSNCAPRPFFSITRSF